MIYLTLYGTGQLHAEKPTTGKVIDRNVEINILKLQL